MNRHFERNPILASRNRMEIVGKSYSSHRNGLVVNMEYPRKIRDINSRMVNSAVWEEFEFRDDDIIVSTFPKSGTTWAQQIVAQLIFRGADDIDVHGMSPWLDNRLSPTSETLKMFEAQRHRRFIKTHLPVDALVYSPKAKYLYIGRDGRDVIWSFHNHRINYTDEFLERLNGMPGELGPPAVRPPEAIRDYFLECIAPDTRPPWIFWEHIRSWWQIRKLPNLLTLHYSDLKADLPGQIRRIAEFIAIEIDERRWPAILEHCGFDYMKRHADKYAPRHGRTWKGGGRTFFNKGFNAQWRDTLTAADCDRYEALARHELGDECANWLAQGGECC